MRKATLLTFNLPAIPPPLLRRRRYCWKIEEQGAALASSLGCRSLYYKSSTKKEQFFISGQGQYNFFSIIFSLGQFLFIRNGFFELLKYNLRGGVEAGRVELGRITQGGRLGHQHLLVDFFGMKLLLSLGIGRGSSRRDTAVECVVGPPPSVQSVRLSSWIVVV